MNNGPDKNTIPLVLELAGIKDISMRSLKIADLLKKLSPLEAAFALHKILEGNLHGDPKSKSAYLALIKNRSLINVLGYDKTAQIYFQAKEKGYSHVLSVLKSPLVKKKKESDREGSALSSKLMHLTLGEKKAFARRKDFKFLEFLLFDTNPSVIANVLKNPRLTEREVIRVASNKNAPRAVLEEIFSSDKWLSRYRIMKSLVFNENTPLDISLNLCSFLLKQDLKMIMGDKKLDPAIVNRAREIMAEKKLS